MNVLTSWVLAPLPNVYYLLFALCAIGLAIIIRKVYARYQQISVMSGVCIGLVNVVAVVAMILITLPIYQLNTVNERAVLLTTIDDDDLFFQAVATYKEIRAENNNAVNAEKAKIYVLANGLQRKSLVEKLQEHQLLTNVVWLSSSYQLANSLPHLQQLYIYGDGLTAEQGRNINALYKGLSVYYFPSKPLLGIVDVNVNKEVLLGESVTLTGVLQANNLSSVYQVALLDINNDELAQLSVRANEPFTLQFTPKATGINRYTLITSEKRDADIAITEKMAVNVTEGKKVNVLVKTASPSFEVRHLKNWLSAQKSQLTVISQTSKNAYLTQTVNSQSSNIQSSNSQSHIQPLSHFTLKELQPFDMLMLDARTVISLTNAEQKAVLTAVNQGLALYVFADENVFVNSSRKGGRKNNKVVDLLNTIARFSEKTNENRNQSTSVHYQNKSSEALLVPLNINLTINDNNKRAKILAANNQQQPLTIAQQVGFGQVAITTISHTYQWKLSGLTQSYGQYWQSVFKQLTQERSKQYWLPISNNDLLLPMDMQSLCYAAENAKHQVIHQKQDQTQRQVQQPKENATDQKISSNKVIGREFNYCIDWTFTESGWHQFTLTSEKNSAPEYAANNAVMHVYINHPSEWLAWQQKIKQQATLQYGQEVMQESLQGHLHPFKANPLIVNSTKANKNNIAKASEESSTGKKTDNNLKYPVNKFPIWLVFIVCCTILWVERKLFI